MCFCTCPRAFSFVVELSRVYFSTVRNHEFGKSLKNFKKDIFLFSKLELHLISNQRCLNFVAKKCTSKIQRKFKYWKNSNTNDTNIVLTFDIRFENIWILPPKKTLKFEQKINIKKISHFLKQQFWYLKNQQCVQTG